jgi:hypothetical protein
MSFASSLTQNFGYGPFGALVVKLISYLLSFRAAPSSALPLYLNGTIE